MQHRAQIFAMTTLILGAGCWPRELIVWDPAGETAAVIVDGTLRFCDAEGRLTDTDMENVRLVRWFHDGTKLLLVRRITVETWDEIAAIIGEERATELAGHAEALLERLEKAEDWAEELKRYQDQHGLSDDQRRAVAQYLREHHLQRLERAHPRAERLLPARPPTMHVLVVHPVDHGALGPLTRLAGCLASIDEVVIAPDDAAAVFVSQRRLFVLPTDGSQPARELAKQAARYPDWTPDGRSIVYISAMPDVPESIAATLSRQQVRADRGDLLSSFAEPEHLVVLAALGEERVRHLRDGRILFSALKVDLPAAPEDISPKAQLFVLEPERRATVARVIPRSAVEEHLGAAAMQYFQVSPDQQRVAIPCDDGRVMVLTLATGEVVEAVAEADPDEGLRMVPTWRNSDQLMCLRPAEGRDPEAARPEIILWSADVTRVLSADWPVELLEGFRPGKQAR